MQYAEFMKFAKKPEHSISDIHALFVEARGTVSLSAEDRTNKTLLDYAARIGNLNLAIWLILQGADVNSQHSGGKTPLFHAMETKILI